MMYDIFLDTTFYGWIGPIFIVLMGYACVKAHKGLGVLWFVVQCLFMASYFELVATTPAYWWHILLILFGGLFTLIPELMKN